MPRSLFIRTMMSGLAILVWMSSAHTSGSGLVAGGPDLAGWIVLTSPSLLEATYQPAIPQSSRVVDAQAVEQFGNDLEKAIYAKTPIDLAQFFDLEWMSARLLADLDQNDATIKNLIRGWKQGYLQSNPLSMMQDVVTKGGSYDFLKVINRGGELRAMFRMVRSDGGYNYHEFPLAYDDQGRLKAYDIYVHLNAEFQTETSRRLLLGYLKANQPALLPDVKSIDHGSLSQTETIQQMAQLIQSGQNEKALRIYYQMPENARQLKHVLTMRYNAAFGLDDHEEIFKTYELFSNLYPQDNCLNFLGITYFSSKGEYDRTLACMDSISRAVGGDPFIDVKKAEVHELKDEYDTAQKLIAGALRQDDSLIDAYWLMVTISLNEENHAKTLEWLKKLDTKFEVEWNDISKLEDYNAFVKSPQYKQWTDYLASRTK